MKQIEHFLIFGTPEQNRKEITHTNYTSSVVSLHNFNNCAVQNLKRPIRLLGCISCGWSKPFLSSKNSRLGTFIDHTRTSQYCIVNAYLSNRDE
ncbi:hypothetical protein EZV62_009019 [Acer yangbiense]|uniref:Uncharacterized protein n=1 Tax=Acer yangbiense TaxID=1000413 RepID=A0A5C7IFH6_9ROSI|nr:hypothetical protein EZV62_017987 [Acer yangbiense]TXG67744.1 hypothetical protein EZV62_009019 [Acer yangbiense]